MAGFGNKYTKKHDEKSQTCHDGDGDAVASYKKALDCHVKGSLKSAEKEYRKAMKLGLLEPGIYSNLGLICKNSGRINEAILLFKKAISISPEHPDAYTNLGLIYKSLGDFEQAIYLTLESYKLKPLDPLILMNLGGIYQDLGRLDQALEFTLQSLKLKQDNSIALGNLGSIFQQLGRFDEALSSTLKSLELEPKNHNTLLNLGVIYTGLDKLDQALECTIQSLEIKPDNPDALMNLAVIYRRNGSPDRALPPILKYSELKPNNPLALLTLAGIYIDLGELNDALIYALKSFNLNPKNYTTCLVLGNIYRDLGRPDEAIFFTHKSLELNSDNSDAHINLALIYKTIGSFDQALASILSSLEINPRNSNAYTSLGSIYSYLKDYDKAINAYKKAFEYNPSIENECRARLGFPYIVDHVDEVSILRSEYMDNARSIFGSKKEKTVTNFLNLGLFMLPYQNGNDDKQFLEELGKLVSPWLQVSESLGSEETEIIQHQESQLFAAGAQRVGFYFDNTHSGHVVFRHYFNIVKSCREVGLEVVIIKGPNAANQDCTELEKYSTCVTQISSNLENSVKILKNLSLQVLVYTEIFSSPVPYCLAHNKIAATQVVLPGNLITTGIPTVDYFISSEYMETKDSHKLYSEKLIQLKGMPHGITDISLATCNGNRSNFNLPEDAQIFGLLHNPIKFHPDWDQLLEEIAQRDSNSIFLLTGKNTKPHGLLVERLKKNAPTFLSQCRSFTHMSIVDYFNLLSCVDVVLDPIHVGCGTTSIDALSMGIPIVSKPEDVPRTQIVQGLYKLMDIKEAPIARSDSEYVYWCGKMSRTRAEYRNLSQKIKSRFARVSDENKKSIIQLVKAIKSWML